MNPESQAEAPASPRIRQHRPLGKQLGLRSGDALVVVDVQRDFLPGGSLAVPAGDEVVAPLNAYIAAFAERDLPIVLTRDWHPPDHCSFRESGGKWPAHCVQDTPGAEWAKGLHVPPAAHVVSKGMHRNTEAYSGFEGTPLAALLHNWKVQRLFVGGLATDYCVRATVMDARAKDFAVVVLDDAIRGIDAKAGDESRAIREMLERGATLFESSHAPTAAAQAAGTQALEIYGIGKYGFGVAVALPFDAAVVRVTQALQNEGFGVLTDIDVTATLRKKLDVSIQPYRILGACNPPLAHRALSAEPSIGLLLPCNVVVREDDSGVVHVEFLDPNMLSALAERPEIADLARQVRRKLRHALLWI